MAKISVRLSIVAGALALLAVMIHGSAPAADAVAQHRLVLQSDTDDVEVMNMVLGNAMNAKAYYDKKGESLQVEIVAYGPGIAMLRADKAPVMERLNQAKAAIPGLTLSMCNNSKMKAEKAEGHEVTPLPGVQVVPAGIVRIMQLEEQGWSYVRP
jgi:intracellular sulfur oxidation DsrE/DsrF family protein